MAFHALMKVAVMGVCWLSALFIAVVFPGAIDFRVLNEEGAFLKSALDGWLCKGALVTDTTSMPFAFFADNPLVWEIGRTVGDSDLVVLSIL